MARKVIDLTGKIGLSERPQIKVGDVMLTVNNSARNMIQVLSITGADVDPAKVFEATDLLFDAKSKKAIDKMDLSLDDYMTVLEAAMDAIMGGEDAEGEAPTPATT